MLVVENAVPGSTLFMRLHSTVDGDAWATIKIDADKTYAYRRFYMIGTIDRQPNFTGTIEYTDQRAVTWPVMTTYPRTRLGECVKESVPVKGHHWLRCAYSLTMPDGETLALEYYKVDPEGLSYLTLH